MSLGNDARDKESLDFLKISKDYTSSVVQIMKYKYRYEWDITIHSWAACPCVYYIAMAILNNHFNNHFIGILGKSKALVTKSCSLN